MQKKNQLKIKVKLFYFKLIYEWAATLLLVKLLATSCTSGIPVPAGSPHPSRLWCPHSTKRLCILHAFARRVTKELQAT